MNKDSIIIFTVSVLLTAAIVGGMYYMTVIRQPAPQSAQKPTNWQTISPQKTQTVGKPSASATTSTNRTNTPIKCIDPEVGEFWTNAATCEGADLYNRISIAEPVVTPPEREQYSNENYQSPQEIAEQSRSKTGATRRKETNEPHLRGVAKKPPKGLSVSCKFSVGKALELERALSAADDPRESIWVKDYCRWREEARDENCEVPGDLFYYENLCDYIR